MTLKNLVLQTSESIGSGDFSLSPVPGWRTFVSAFGTGSENVGRYTIRHTMESEYEIGNGYIGTTGYLVRSEIIESSNGNNIVDFSGGTKEVVCSADSDYLISLKPTVQAHIEDADGTLADITAKFNDLLNKLETAGVLESV